MCTVRLFDVQSFKPPPVYSPALAARSRGRIKGGGELIREQLLIDLPMLFAYGRGYAAILSKPFKKRYEKARKMDEVL